MTGPSKVTAVERFPEPVIGWRVWNLSDDGGAPALWPGGSGSDAWPHRIPVDARCTMPRLLTGRRGRHDVPDLRCRCGIYAGDSLDVIDRERPAWPPPPVIGRAALWGRTIEHERGWRARFGYPDRLRLACAVCAWIEPGPGIPLVVHRFGGRLYALCEVHAGGIQLPDGRRTEPIGTEPRALQSRLLEAYAVDLLPAEPLEALFRRPPAPEVPAFFPAVRVLSRRPQA